MFFYFIQEYYYLVFIVLNEDYSLDYFNNLKFENTYFFFKDNNLLRESVKNSKINCNLLSKLKLKNMTSSINIKWETEVHKWKLRANVLKWIFFGKRNNW